ncbi:ABC transporter ATP-binding protein [Primorskyibacter sp. 2E107]|uniref:ABC transporter ATP-binding protein n=1 Tax=Primorskyibacter sp. 2E107 TaxID=3403458 RepID=UPI003AF86C14
MANVTFQNVHKRFGTYVALEKLDLDIHDGEFVALLGPSGCGKSTTLRMLAGLDFPTSGEIRIGDRVVNDLAPGKRDIAMVFQSYALYPHMTVAENIAYPLKKRGIKGRAREDAVQKAAELLQLESVLHRKPKQLSGGQQQRVALGRALVREPRVFLLDEPLSNLDAKLRSYMRAELIELHRRLGKTMVYVTHDQLEAMTMASRIAVMHGGLVQQFDTPDVIYNRPANRFVAGFIGTPPMNQIAGAVEGGDFVIAGHRVPIDRTAFDPSLKNGASVLGIRPEFVRIGSPASSEDLPAIVRLAENTGHETIVTLELPDSSRIAARTEAGRRLDVGQLVGLRFQPDAIHLFEATENGARLNLDHTPASVIPMRSK